MTTVYLFKVYCIAEAQYVNVWAEDTPTLCPNDHPDRSINPLATQTIDTRTLNQVRVEEPTDGYWMSEEIPMNIPATAPGAVVDIDSTWPYDIRIWRTEFKPIPDSIGDTFSIEAGPNTTVGVLTAPVTGGVDTVFTVSQTVTDNISIGFDVRLTDGGNTEDLGRCIGVDKVNFQIEVENAPVNNYAAGVTLVQMTNVVVRNHTIQNVDRDSFGDKGFKSKLLPANTVLRMSYTNNNGLAKSWPWRVEHYYGNFV